MSNPTDKMKSDEPTDLRRASFEKETTEGDHKDVKHAIKDDRRSLMGAPVDPNSPTSKGNFPPGVPSEDVKDPGRATPGAPPVDNRSGSGSK